MSFSDVMHVLGKNIFAFQNNVTFLLQTVSGDMSEYFLVRGV